MKLLAILFLFPMLLLAQEKEQPVIYTSGFELAKADIDSIYDTAFKSRIVTENITNNFMSAGLLYTRQYDLELKSILRNKTIDGAIKKKLLINRITADYKKYGGKSDKYKQIEYLEITSRKDAITNFRKTNNSIFSWILYIINGVPYGISDINSYQQIISQINKMDITKIEILEGEIINCNACIYGVIIIRDDYR
jgi:hypothetical protein